MESETDQRNREVLRTVAEREIEYGACFITLADDALDLKRKRFRPEDAGKMHLDLSAVDRGPRTRVGNVEKAFIPLSPFRCLIVPASSLPAANDLG